MGFFQQQQRSGETLHKKVVEKAEKLQETYGERAQSEGRSITREEALRLGEERKQEALQRRQLFLEEQEKRKSMEHFETSSTNDSAYQCVVCHLSCGIVCYVYLHPKIKRDKLGDLMEILTRYSQKANFLGVIGDLNIRTEFGMDTSTKLLDEGI